MSEQKKKKPIKSFSIKIKFGLFGLALEFEIVIRR